MIDNSTKQQITEHLNKYVENAGSQNKAKTQLGISIATISNMLAGNWEGIADQMWRRISKILGVSLDEQWQHVETAQWKAISGLFADAQYFANVYGVTAVPGSGKTYALDQYRKINPNVFYVKCDKHTVARGLLSDLLLTMGKNSTSACPILLYHIQLLIEKMANPVIIIDELEKVKPDTMFLFIDLYNRLKGKCGIVLLGTPNFETLIDKGVEKGRLCYNEFLSRIGGKFVNIPAPSTKDGSAIIQAQGITDQFEINAILDDSNTNKKTTAIDLRRVERLVHKEKLLKEAKS